MPVKLGRYKVQVMQEDIDNGIKENPCHCPIALAACRVLNIDPDDKILEVDDRISFPAYWIKVLMPSVSDFVVNFDEGRAVGPWEFDMELVEETVE